MVFADLPTDGFRNDNQALISPGTILDKPPVRKKTGPFDVAGVTGPGSLRLFSDVVHRCIPVIRLCIEFLHPDACLFKGVTNRGSKAEGGDRLGIPGIHTEQEHGFRGAVLARMAVITVPVRSGGMAPVAADPSLMFVMGGAGIELLLTPQFVTGFTVRPVRDHPHRFVHRPVAVEFRELVAIHA